MRTLLLVAVMVTGQRPPADAEPESVEAVEAREAIELAREEVATYTLYFDAAREIELQMREDPILRWTNHLQRRFYGDVFIWTHDGRPEAVATITNSYGKYHAMETEAHSLSLRKFTATRADQPMWNPATAGITLAQVPDAPDVADVPARRLQQMRGIARRFSASSSAGSRRLQLRLLPQPVYRYASADAGVSDGAMFVFTNGTDPDVFLLIEARQAAGKTSWQYAIARFNSHVDLQVSYDNREVWMVPRMRGGELKDPNSTYFAFQRRFQETKGLESD